MKTIRLLLRRVGSLALPLAVFATSSFGAELFDGKTLKGWEGTCRQLVVKLSDDTSHRAQLEYDGDRYGVELEPHTTGPGPHSHEEDDVFYVLAGTMSILVDGAWIDAEQGAFVLVPGGMQHDFENRGDMRAGVLNFSAPGGFEPAMPEIRDWFLAHPPGRAGT